MSIFGLILRGLAYHRRIHGSVAAGVAAATAVITGALLVGDSVQGTLRHLTLDRLGRIADVLVAPHFFRVGLAEALGSQAKFKQDFSTVVPAILLQATLENPAGEHHARAGHVTLLGCDKPFWSLGGGGPRQPPAGGELVLNQPLADELGVKAGDEVLVRLGQVSQIPPDSALGRKTDTLRSRRLVVSQVIPASGLGRFGLNPTQLAPSDAFASLATLQSFLEQPDKVNALIVAGKESATPPSAEADALLADLLQPALADYGFSLERTKRGYVQFASARMLLEPAAEQVVLTAFHDLNPQPVFTYLANTLAVGDRKIPYSTIAAIDFRTAPPLGPFKTSAGDAIGPLADDEIALNTWAAEDLGAKPGDTVELTYFEPESTHGKIEEKSVRLRLRGVVAMDETGADPDLTPELKGVTDQRSIADWNPPFPFDASRIRKKDERYWDQYRATPKAFVSLATGRRLWSSRFGRTTALRIPAGQDVPVEELAGRLKFDPAALGFDFLPVKRLGLAASAGTTPFNWLFLGLSFFIVAAAVMLVSLLFRLGIEQRAEEIGILAGIGLRRGQIARVLAGEGLVVAALGGLLGLLVGVAYAWLMLVGLRTWWQAAVNTSGLQFYATPLSFLEGYLIGVVVSLLTILLALRRLGRVSVRRLLAGQSTDELGPAGRPRGWGYAFAGLAAIAAVVVGFSALRLSGEAQAGAFVGSGALVLAAALAAILARLRSQSDKALVTTGGFPLARLALRNGERNPWRSTLTIGLIGAASFLIVAMSAFRLDPKAEGAGRDSGSGGFALIVETDQPIYQDLNSPAGREELSFSAAADQALAGCTTVALRVQSGDDASCLNLYQPTRPQVLGAPDTLIRRGGFAWDSSAAETIEERENPWLLLYGKRSKTAGGGDAHTAVPVVLDANTAMYSLHKGLGDPLEITDGRGRPLTLRIVALLKNSIFQGSVLMSEQDFLAHFPDVSGYRLLLVDTKRQPPAAVREALADGLGDYGAISERSVDRLASLLAVQNTYLSTFQSLGALGLLLGTFGLATVQLRSVLERRGELALLRATGFRRAALARLVLLENALLLAAGLGTGIAAALVATLPHWYAGGAAVPWLSLAATLAVVFGVGLAAGSIAVRAVLQAQLIPALRGD